MNKRRFGLILLALASLIGIAYVVGLMILASPPPPLVYASRPYSGKPVSRQTGPVQEGKFVHSVSPSYPELAREMRWRPPYVNMEVTVGEDGRVSDVKIIRGHPLCDDSVRLALSQWKYRPTLLNGTAVPVSFLMSLPCGDPYHGKLDPDVALLIDRIRAGKTVDAKEFVFVHEGIANVELTVSNPRNVNLDALRRLGFVTSKSGGESKLIGSLPVFALDALRTSPFITFIAPHPK